MMQIEDPDAGGCFAVGLDRSSKPFNAGTLNRLVAAQGGAYTFTATRISGDNDCNELANTPRHAASLWLSHRFEDGALDGLTLGGGLRHIGSRWSSDANTARLDAVTLLDLSASYDWANGMQGRLSVSNLTDEAYVSAVGLGSSYYGDGRTVQASLSYRW